MAPDSAREWVLYVRDGCHLCEEFLLALELEVGPSARQVRVVDVAQDSQVAVRYGLRVPVLEVGGHLVCEGRYDAPRVRQALQV